MRVRLDSSVMICVSFFLVLFYGLFLGDGMQSLIEPYITGSILVLFVGLWLQKKSLVLPDHKVHIAWILVLLAQVLLTAFSKSIGYSISDSVRVFIGYLTFILFLNLGSARSLVSFQRLLIFFISITSVVGLILLVIPTLAQSLPPTNLLFAFYGHNHLAVLLLFVVPYAVDKYLEKRTWQQFVYVVFIFVSLVLTFSRGVWCIVAFYLIFKFWLFNKSNKSIPRSLFVILACLLVGSFTYWIVSKGSLGENIPYHIRPQILKSSPLEHRIPYWEQAVKSFISHPLTGSGPGTFYLESLRLQSQPNLHSYYAHSYPLQILSEIGIVGFSAFCFLFFMIAKKLYYISKLKKRSDATQSVLLGLTLVFLYSFVDFGFNFFIVWVLFWAIVGIFYGSQSDMTSIIHPKLRLIPGVVFVGLFVYFGLTIGSLIAGNNHTFAFDIAPFNKDKALDILEKKNINNEMIPDTTLSTLRFFYAEDPEILRELFKQYQKKGHMDYASYSIGHLIDIDPKNISNHKEYLKWAVQQTESQSIINALIHSTRNILPTKLQKKTKDLTAIDSNILVRDLKMNLSILEAEPAELFHTKLFYLTGLGFVEDDPGTTRNLWILARDTYPLAGLLYHELASLSLTHFSDKNAATVYVDECMQVPHAALHCKQIHKDFGNLPPPGFVKEDILNLEY